MSQTSLTETYQRLIDTVEKLRYNNKIKSEVIVMRLLRTMDKANDAKSRKQ